MLKLPAFMHKQFDTGETVTVFQDDAQFWKFYLIPGFPTVRTDPNGNPVFMLIKFNLSDESRERDPNLPRGGGYMVFDSELKIKKEHQDTIVDELKPYVREEYNRLRANPNRNVRELTMGATFNDIIGAQWAGTGQEGTVRAPAISGTGDTKLKIPGPDTEPLPAQVPPVLIGEPLWKSGKVTMNAPASAGLVSNKIGERPASLIGNNVAAFSLDLTTDGATFMEKTLIGTGGGGASDLTPIQVVYELSLLAKLPPARMYVKFNTASLYHAVQELFHEHNNCSDDYFTSETMMTTAIEAGLVTIKIDAGGVTDSEIIQTLMQQATNSVQELLTKRFATKERKPLEEWANNDIATDSAEVYRLKRQTEVDMTDFEQTMDLQTTTEYKIAPQGTLQAFFKKVKDMSPFVRVVDTNDPFFMTLDLKARAFAKWAEDGIAFVDVDLKYGKDPTLKTKTFTFTPDKAEAQLWDPSIADGKREFQYRWRVCFQGRDPDPWTAWETTTTRNLNVAVETPGKLQVEVTGVGLDFENILDAVLVHLRYQDQARQVPKAGQSILITKDRPSGTWTRLLYAPWDKPVEYRIEYLLKSGTTVAKDWTATQGPTQNIIATRPDIDVLDLTLVPAGRWTDVIQAVASLRYCDGAYQRDVQFNFKTADEFKKWAVILLNSSKRKFQYKILGTFKNGDVQETEWLEREGDQALPVTLVGPPRLDVKVMGAVLDYASTPVAKVDLEYRDDAGNVHDIQSISLQKPEQVELWSVPIRKDGPRNYSCKITYYPTQGNPVEREPEVTNTELIIVPRYSVPKIGADFSPTLQDFARTPAVEVNLAYDDAQHNVHERSTLVFTKNEHQTWFVPVADTAPRAYDMSVTWYFADGRDKTVGPVKVDKPAVILPRPAA